MSKLVPVQVLRAFAALAVVVLHAQHDADALGARLGVPFQGLQAPWIAGVDVFFVISGLIMVHASTGLFGAVDAGRLFLARRLARIVPLYWAVTSLYLAVAWARPALLNSEQISPGLVVASYLFLPAARSDGVAQPVYSLGWTLNYEMLFYAGFAVALVWPLWRGLTGLALVLCGLVALGQALAPLPLPLAFWCDPIILEFVFGMILAVLRLRGIRLPALVRLGLAAAGLALLALDPMRSLSGFALARPLAYGLPAAMLVAAAALGPAEWGEGRLGRLGRSLGDASYAIYLLHPFVVRSLREILWQTGLAGALGPAGLVALALPLTALASLGVFRWFERPATAWARRRLGA